ncbi:MAG: hypothetical protein LQ345_006238 [Seirophora villosa]|nr:MAG: hypothetical protein LQ345_006238 [Seirophora villosa]
MPRGNILGGNGYNWGVNELPSTSSTLFGPTTDTIDFAYSSNPEGQFSDNNLGGWSKYVNPTAANRSGGMAAPSVANNANANGLGDNTEVGVDNTVSFSWQSLDQLQEHQLAFPDAAQCYDRPDEDHLDLAGQQASFSHSTATPPEFTVNPPFGQSALRDEAERLSEEPCTQSAVGTTLPATVTAQARNSQPRGIITREAATPTQREQNPRLVPQSTETPPPHPAPKRGRPRKQKEADPRPDMSRTGLSHNGREKETASYKKDGSLSSSTRSVRSHSSFDFHKVDRLGGSPNTPGLSRLGQRSASQVDQRSLPDEKGFSIQIGAELFKLSGASIMSDGRAPSYFSAFFIEQLEQNDDRTGGVRTLFIDRDPDTFRDIARHLQGYLVTPTDGSHFVKLFADAQFYRLPRLQSQLFESEIFVEVGSQHFHIPRDIFNSPGDTPNYFTLGFTVFFSSPGDVFPGLNPRGLLRPPAIHPPRIPNRSPQIFSDLLHMLRGYPLTIQNSNHRAQLLKDARYYNLRGLEQKLIPHSIAHNVDRQVSEMVIRLQDIKPSQVSLAHNPSSSPSSSFSLPHSLIPTAVTAYITYARPYIDETSYHLILEVPSSSSSSEPLSLNLHAMRATLSGTTQARITALFQTIANKLNLPTTMPLGLMMNDTSARVSSPGTTPLSEDDVKVLIDAHAHVVLDGQDVHLAAESGIVGSGAPGAEEAVIADENFSTVETNVWTSFGLPPSPLAPVDDDDSDGDDGDEDDVDDGRNVSKRPHTASPLPSTQPSKRLKTTTTNLNLQGQTWTIHRGQWRLRVQPRSPSSGAEEDGSSMEIVMEAVKIEATSGEKARNAQRGFLE